MTQWIKNNLAPISFFTLVIMGIIGINVSNSSTNSKVDLLLSQSEQIQKDIEKYDSFLLYTYATKTEDYKTFNQDVLELKDKLRTSLNNLTPVPTDEECTQLREDVKRLVNFKIDIYERINSDLEPYLNIYDQIKTVGQFKKAILNPDKVSREQRLESLTKISQAGKEILSFYKTNRAGEPQIIEKVTKDTGYMDKALESLQNNPEIETKLYDEIVKNFGADERGVEAWPLEEPAPYTLDQNILGLNEAQTAITDIKESTKAVKSKYKS